MKKLFLITIFVCFLLPLSAQEATEYEADIVSKSEIAPENEETIATEASQYTADFVLQFEPGIYINTESVLVSAPSPIVYPISVGFIWPDSTALSVQPTVSFFMMQHLYYEDRALPAEIENRTTTTLSFMLNIPAVYSIFLSNSNFQLSAGLGVFMRFGLLSPGVKEDDSGWSGSLSSAGS